MTSCSMAVGEGARMVLPAASSHRAIESDSDIRGLPLGLWRAVVRRSDEHLAAIGQHHFPRRCHVGPIPCPIPDYRHPIADLQRILAPALARQRVWTGCLARPVRCLAVRAHIHVQIDMRIHPFDLAYSALQRDPFAEVELSAKRMMGVAARSGRRQPEQNSEEGASKSHVLPLTGA